MARLFYAININPNSKTAFGVRCQNVKNFISNEFDDLPVHFIQKDDRFLAIVGYHSDLNIDINSGCLGFVSSQNWNEEGVTPDGNFFIYKTGIESIELLSDYCSTRSIWYYHNPGEYFCFSSFQLPLILFKGVFNFNKKVTSWMLSTGCLGPNNSWDQDIKLLPRLTSLKFIHTEDKVTLSSYNVIAPNDVPTKESELVEYFDNYLKKGFEKIVMPVKSTALLLSGGGESRLLLWYLGIKHKLQTITWTTPASEKVLGSDVQIAKALSTKYNVPHTIFYLKNESLPPKEILNRFLKYGEGRVDHISGYMDGFELWKKIQNSGISSIIRGDHNFGRYKSTNYTISRKLVGAQWVDDFENLKKYKLNQEINDYVKPSRGESPMSYTYRLAIDFRHPLINSALNDFKLNFSEVNNPLLNNSMVSLSTVLPQYMMKNKRLTKKRNKINIPDIPIATSVSIESLKNMAMIFKDEFVESFSKVSADDLKNMDLPENLFQDIKKYTEGIRPNTASETSNGIKKFIPKSIKKFLLSLKKDNVPFSKLAFRAFILVNMNKKIEKLLIQHKG